MACGFTGSILRVNLTTRHIETLTPGEELYRRYLGGGALGTYFLLREGAAQADPLSEHNVLTIAAGVTTGAAVSGASRVCLTALSPITGLIGDSQAGGRLGPYLKRAGYDAFVLTGRAASLSYLYVDDTTVEIRSADKLAGRTVLGAHEALVSELGGKQLSILPAPRWISTTWPAAPAWARCWAARTCGRWWCAAARSSPSPPSRSSRSCSARRGGGCPRWAF